MNSRTFITFVHNMRTLRFKYLILVVIMAVLTVSSCKKEIIVPVNADTDEIMNTRGSTRDPIGDGGGDNNGSVTDPDNETEDDKVKVKKKKASN